jgi:hypothetical protein
MKSKRSGLVRVRTLVAALPDVEEGTTFGFPAFKVKAKTFAWFPKKQEVEDGTLAVRMSILERDFLIAKTPAAYYLTPHYRDYTAVLARPDVMTDAALKDLLDAGREFILTEGKRRRALKGRRP